MGQKIKAARKSAGLTQRELGQKIGKGFSTIQKYENGVIEPPISTVVKIAEELGITPIQLVETATAFPGEQRMSDICIARIEEAFKLLNEDGLWKAVERIEELTEIQKYQK